jgi:hypothetical protein
VMIRTYKANRTVNNEASMDTALAVLKVAIGRARFYLTEGIAK